jgi:hypothetical protein
VGNIYKSHVQLAYIIKNSQSSTLRKNNTIKKWTKDTGTGTSSDRMVGR